MWTDKRLFVQMCGTVASNIGAIRKSTLAAIDIADIRTFTGMDTHMPFERAAFSKAPVTIGIFTHIGASTRVFLLVATEAETCAERSVTIWLFTNILARCKWRLGGNDCRRNRYRRR